MYVESSYLYKTLKLIFLGYQTMGTQNIKYVCVYMVIFFIFFSTELLEERV